MTKIFDPKLSLFVSIGIVAISYSNSLQLQNLGAILVFLVIAIDVLEKLFINHKQNNSASQQLMNREMIISLAAYWLMSKVNPELDKKIEFLFWGFFILEIALQFFVVKKFKQPLQFRPVSVYTANHILNCCFAMVILLPIQTQVFYWVFVLLFIGNIESIVIVYLLPFWKDDIKWVGDALKIRNEYKKYLKR